MKNKFLLLAALAIASSVGLSAQTVRSSAKNQSKRIAQGVKSGELTRKETRNLVQDQKEIRKDVKSAKADGTVTKEERKEIKQAQRNASKEINRKKHNGRDRN